MKTGVNDVFSGAASLGQAIANVPRLQEIAAREALQQRIDNDYTRAGTRQRMASADYYGTQAELDRDRLQYLQGLDPTALVAEQGGDPAMGPSYASLMRAGGGNAEQLANALLALQAGRMRQGATQQPDGAAANMLLAAGGRTPLDLYSQNAAGQVLNEQTGATDASSPLAQAAIAASLSQNVPLGNTAIDVTTGQPIYQAPVSVSPGNVLFDPHARQEIYQAPHKPGEANGTTAAKQRAELLALGYPDHLATGIGYGTIRKVDRFNPDGTFSSDFIDIATGLPVTMEAPAAQQSPLPEPEQAGGGLGSAALQAVTWQPPWLRWALRPGSDGGDAAPITEADIQHTAQKYGMTREEVIQRLQQSGRM